MTQTGETDTTQPTFADRESARSKLEATRNSYKELLKSLSNEDMRQKSSNPKWSVGQLMWHMAWGLDYIPAAVDRARRAKNFNPPQGVFNAVNPWITRLGSRRATPESLARRYDSGHEKVIATLDSVRQEDWDKGAEFMGAMRTAGDYFQGPVDHFNEHQPDILKSLGRA